MALPTLLNNPAVSGEIFVTPSAGSVQPVSQGAAAAITAPWPVELSNGTNQVGTPTAPLSTQPGTGVVTPVSATQLPAALGQTTKSASVSVALASDQGALPVSQSTSPWVVAPVDGQKATYSSAILGLVPAASATDVFTLAGSASKTVRVTRVSVSGTQTTAGEVDIQLLKRSTADTGGTSTAPAAVPHDSADAAATATVAAYTANPAVLGTLVGSIRTRKAQIGSPATVTSQSETEWLFGNRPAQAVVLRGTAQVLAVNLNGVTVTGGSLNVSIEWTEE